MTNWSNPQGPQMFARRIGRLGVPNQMGGGGNQMGQNQPPNPARGGGFGRPDHTPGRPLGGAAPTLPAGGYGEGRKPMDITPFEDRPQGGFDGPTGGFNSQKPNFAPPLGPPNSYGPIKSGPFGPPKPMDNTPFDHPSTSFDGGPYQAAYNNPMSQNQTSSLFNSGGVIPPGPPNSYGPIEGGPFGPPKPMDNDVIPPGPPDSYGPVEGGQENPLLDLMRKQARQRYM